MNNFTKITVAIMTVLTLGACASNRGYQQPQYQNTNYTNQQGVRYGTVQNITVSNSGGSQTSGGGAILGAIVGGVVGNRFGGGTGKDLSTVAGVVGGAIVGRGPMVGSGGWLRRSCGCAAPRSPAAASRCEGCAQGAGRSFGGGFPGLGATQWQHR